jgi:hypothetical protein
LEEMLDNLDSEDRDQVFRLFEQIGGIVGLKTGL